MSAIPVVVVALVGGLAAEPVGIYLPPSQTGGSEFQFNPASAELRETVKQRSPRPDDLLDARALADDLVFLRRAMRKLYPGYPELLQRPDYDVEATFDQTIAGLRAGPPQVKFGASALPFFLGIKRQINDRHLWMKGWDPDPADDFVEYQTTISGAAPALKDCTAPQAALTTLRVAPLLTADGKRSQLLTVSARNQGSTLTLTCPQQAYALTARPPASREDGLWDKPAYEWHRAGQAAVIRIRRFQGPPPEIARLEQLAKDYPAHRRAPVIVFDLRGNGGGNDGYAHDWVNEAKRGPWDSGSWALHPAGSLLSWLIWNQEVWASIEQDRVDAPASVAARNKIRAEWPRSAAQLGPEFKASDARSSSKQPYTGRIFVLVDRKAGSSGESSAQMIRAALGAQVVGERTAGYQEYGNVRPLALPRTHLVFFFATKRNYFRTPTEAVGTPVDVYLPSDLIGKPVEELLPLLKKLRRPNGPDA